MLKLRKGYIDRNNINYNNIMVLDKKDIGDVSLVEHTHNDNLENFYYDDDDSFMSTIVYNSKEVPNLCIRIFGDFGYSNFPVNGYYIHEDEVSFVAELQKRQSLVKNTIFPYGIVINNGIVIGQLCYYFKNSYTFMDGIVSGKIEQIDILNIYKNYLKVLKELVDAGIYYRDIHSRNIMLQQGNEIPKIIDFESSFVHFDDSSVLYNMFNNYINFVNDANSKVGMDNILGIQKNVDSFDSANNQVNEMIKKYRKLRKCG